jgi:hypothetical protein
MRRVCAVCSLILAFGASTPARASAEPEAARPHTFRLGTAASPFGWSTAIGDLNADGRPDYAVADRVGRRASGAAYELELTLGGIDSRSVWFEAPDEALAVTLRDVDHDHDLDVVVTALPSRAVVHIWLNDGHGRFHDAPSNDTGVERQAGAPQADSTRTRDSDAAIDSTPRRVECDHRGSQFADSPIAPLDRLIAGDRRSARPLLAAQLGSRAPPLPTPSI